MSDFVRNLIKWILVVILAILVIFLIVKVANRGKNVEKENPVTPIVDTTKEKSSTEKTTKKEEEKETTTKTEKESEKADGEVSHESALIVNAEDTGTTEGITGLIGIIIIGSTSFFLLKSRKAETVEE